MSAGNNDFITHEVPPGQHIMHAARGMDLLAKFTGRTVVAEFNSHVLVAEPDDTAADIVREWNEAQRASYFGGDR